MENGFGLVGPSIRTITGVERGETWTFSQSTQISILPGRVVCRLATDLMILNFADVYHREVSSLTFRIPSNQGDSRLRVQKGASFFLPQRSTSRNKFVARDLSLVAITISPERVITYNFFSEECGRVVNAFDLPQHLECPSGARTAFGRLLGMRGFALTILLFILIPLYV